MMKYRRILYWIIVIIAVVLPYVGFFIAKHHFNEECSLIENAEFIIINKQDMKLRLYDYRGHLKMEFPIACGKNRGDKKEQGDMRTPEGVFHVSDIEAAWDWSHDFKDGRGEMDSAYGPWFIRLHTPGHKGIGIHGTHDPESIGTRATEGCIRLKNKDLMELKERVRVGMVVVITPSIEDEEANVAIK